MKNNKLQPKQKVTKTSKTSKLTKLSANELNQVNGGWREQPSVSKGFAW